MVVILCRVSPNVAHHPSFAVHATNDKEKRKLKFEQVVGSVRFADEMQVVEIPNRECLSDDEQQNLYLNKREKKKIHKDIIAIVRQRMVETDGHLCDTDETLRGLEACTPKDAERLRKLRKAISAVVRQQKFAKIDDDWLSIIYRPFSEAAAEHARKRGLRDQAAVPSAAPQQITMLR
jgi:hypothetical protein